MRKVIFSINVSLDGFADHTVAIADDELHEFATDLLSTVDTVMFGRVAYQLFERYWPTAPRDPQATQSMIAFADKINSMPKLVFSRTLQNADWNNTRLVKEDAAREVSKLKQGNGRNLSVGGLGIAQALTREALIDEYWFLVQPVIAGQGRRLFDGVKNRPGLKLIDTRNFRSGVVVLHYLLNR